MSDSIPILMTYCPGSPCDPCNPPLLVSILFCQNVHTEANTNFCLGPAPPDGIRPIPSQTSEEYFGKFFGVIVSMGHNYTGGQADSSGINLEYLYSNVQTVTYTYGGLESENPKLYGTPCGTDSVHSIQMRPDPTYPGPDYPPCIMFLDSTSSSFTTWSAMLVLGELVVNVKPGYTLSQYDPTLTKA